MTHDTRKSLEALERHAGGVLTAIRELRADAGKPRMLESLVKQLEDAVIDVRGKLDPVRRRA